MTNKKDVLLLFGGESTEHDVSIASARNVFAAIDTTNYDVHLCFIDRTGRFWHVTEVVDHVPEGAQELLPHLGKAGFVTRDGKTVDVDVLLPILHGRNGEDGAVQALAQLLHIPIVGCDMASSSLSMNKLATKRVVDDCAIPIVPYQVHHVSDDIPAFESVAKDLGDVLFVKPVNAGSSIGVSRVTNQHEWEAAVSLAHSYDPLILIEKAIDARELEVAVIGNYPDVSASVVGEINPDGEFYSYDSKYDENSTSGVIIPADVSTEVSDIIRAYAIEIFHVLGCSGLSRVDFFVDRSNGDIYFNEINTLPGFTDISMYPKLWQHEGVSYSDLISRLIELAIARG